MWVVGDIGSQIVNPSAAVNQVAGRGDRRHEPPDELGDHDRQRPRRAEQLQQYQPVRMAQAPPEIDVHFLTTNNPPTGLGEPALPPDAAGGLQRDLRGHRQARPHAAAREERFPLGAPATEHCCGRP